MFLPADAITTLSAPHDTGSFAPRDASRADLRLRFGLPAAALLFVGWLALSQLRTWFELWPGVSVWYAPAALLAAG